MGPFDEVKVEVGGDGAIEVVSGAASVGQGMETVLAQICADTLGVDYKKVHVVHGQTDRIERGMGAFASRVTVMAGEATRMAASALRDKALAAAAELLQAPVGLLDVVDGEIVRTDATSGPSISLGALARTLQSGGQRARGEEGRAFSRSLFPHQPHELPLWRAHRRHAG